MGTTARKKAAALALAFALAVSLVPASMAFAADENSATGGGSWFDGVAEFFAPVTNALGFGGEAEAADNGVQPLAAGVEGDTVADDPTMDTWGQITDNTTRDVGRIWTDKSVSDTDVTLSPSNITVDLNEEGSDAADFLVSLSAFSSASNAVSSSTKPLDIVLLLDTSGSMAYYMPVYEGDLDRDEVYYLNEEGVTDVTWNDRRNSWGYTERGQWRSIDPKDSADGRGTQLYGGERKIDALKTAVNGFIDATAGETSADSQHRIALVTFASEGYIRSDFTSNFNSLKTTVNGLGTGGGTQAGDGMSSAATVMNGNNWDYQGARDNAQKVLIFFTDGKPGNSGFNDAVAGSAINQAKAFKDAGTLVYSIGVFGEADPSVTDDQFNRYMNAVSSNYPDAECIRWNQQINDFGYLQLGDRATAENPDDPQPQYYFAASNSEQLSGVFDQIAQNIQSEVSGSPTQVEDGYQNRDGYITFTDQLGDFMDVIDMKQIVYANNEFTYDSSNKDEATHVTTYHFTGTFDGNHVYEPADMSNVIVEVHEGQGSAGDTVVVKIPASIIPLKYYDINTNEGQTTASIQEAFPLRVFYSVGLRDTAAEQIADGIITDSALQSYIDNTAHQNEDGEIEFLSNNWANGANGTTTATFEPSTNNSFYYFVNDTQLYNNQDENDPACATYVPGHWEGDWWDRYWVPESWSFDYDGTYYYQRTYYTVENGTAVEHTEWVAINGAAEGLNEGNVRFDSSNNYSASIVGGTPKQSRIDDYVVEKNPNSTETATNALSSSWGTQTENQTTIDVVNVALGNNGKLAVGLPGTLEVTKSVVTDGTTNDAPTSDADGNPLSFTFQISLKGADGADLAGKYTAQAYSGPTAVGPQFEVSGVDDPNTDRNETVFTLEAGQTMRISGLPAGAHYTVTETATAAGYMQTLPADGASANGTIASNHTSTAAFTNTYHANAYSLDGATHLSVSKVFEGNGRNWSEGESYTFELIQSQDNPVQVTLPGNVTLGYDPRSNNSASGSFGDIELTQEGTYVFYIHEVEPAAEDQIPGVDYSDAWYGITVRVYDGHNGSLVADEDGITMVQLRSDAGQDVENDATTATFTNTYDATSGPATIEGNKVYDNESGANELTNGKFTFKLEPVGGYATAAGAPADGAYTIPADEVPMPLDEGGTVIDEATNVDTYFNFPVISYGADTVDNTYVYRVTEVNDGEAGMTYSDDSFEVSVAVTDDTEDAEGHAIIVATVTYPEGGVTFTNEFNPTPATVALEGTKEIDGRDFKADETFGFTLAPYGTTQTAIESGWLTMPENTTATASSADNGVFTFDDIEFTHTGTYTFSIKETAHNGAALLDDGTEGMTYDRHECVVRVTVELGTGNDAGKLVVTGVDYGTTGADEAARDGNQFVNTYSSSMNYGTAAGGLDVAKKLTGRTMQAGEFDFTITGVDSDIEGAVSGAEASNWLGEDDDAFSNANRRASGVEDVMNKLALMNFTQEQAGNVYVYEVREVIPSAGSADRLGGVTYDDTVWTVAIKVVDDLDGTMHTETTVSNDKNDNVVSYNSDNYATEGAPKVSFANAYEAQPVTEPAGSYFQGNKIFTGRDMDADESFDYTLVGADQTTANAMNGDIVEISETASVKGLRDGVSGTFDFGQATFHRAGIYAFQVTENIPDAAINANVDDGQTTYAQATTEQKAMEGWTLDGITYDSHVATVVINVADDGEGNLYINRQASSVNGMNFSNTYNATPATFGIDGHWDFAKIIDGRDWLDTDSFAFEITASADTPLPNGGTESEGEGVHGKVVTVSDSTGTDGNPVRFDFGEIEFTFDNMDGQPSKEFRYTISEQSSLIAGIKTSGATYQLIITVKDDGNGALEVTDWALNRVEDNDGNTLNPAEPVGEDETATFTNIYTAGVDYIQFSGAKAYVDYSRPGDQLETGMFSFTLEALGGYETAEGAPADGAYTIPAADVPMPEGTPQGQTSVTIPNGEGRFTFKNITFTQDHDGNTYVYKITEVNGGASKVTYDSSEYVASVAVTTTTDEQAHTATIVATPSYTKNGEAYNVTEQNPMTFANSYDPDDAVLTGETAIKGTKTMDGRNIKEDETFSFTLMPVGERTTNAVNSGVITIADNNWQATTAAGDGTSNTADFTFGDITINNLGVAGGDGVYTFEVREQLPSSQNPYQGVTYDTHVATVTVTVSDPDADPSKPGIATGKLTAKVTYNNNTEGVVTDADADETAKAAFTNKYKADPITVEGDADVSFDLTKQFTGRAGNDWLTTDSFTFELLEWGKGTFNDEELTFYPDDPAQAAPMPEGTAEGSKTVQVTIDRTDRTDVANGIASIEFAPITFTEAGDYNYTVYEVVPSDGAKIPGVVYDESRVISIVVRVTDDGNGQLHAEVLKPQDEEFDSANGISFYNYYAAQYNYGPEGTLDVTKTLENRAMTDGQFSFTVTATGDNAQAAAAKLGIQDGTSVEVTAPAANAGVAASVNSNPFANLSFTSEERGTTYTYTVDENGESNDNYTYDDEVYTVALTVLDDNSGTLKVQTVVTNAAGEEVANSTSSANEVNKVTLPFVNTYQASDDTKKVEADINGATTEVNGKVVGVGDTLTYTIHWVNDAMDENGVPQAATVTVTDELPTGIEPAEIQNGGVYDDATHTIKWELGEQAADAQGDVTFTATVTEDAVTVEGMTNDATIEVGDDEPKTTNEVTVDVPEKSVEEAGDHIDGEIQVGDRLTYTIEYANNTDATSDVTVVDQVPTGITVDQSTLGGGTFDEDSNTITWVIQSVAAGDRGTVSFTGVVNRSAVHEGTTLDNKASIKVGENGSEFWTNTEPVTVGSGELTISKEIALTADQGTEIDENKEFTFTVNLKDVAGNALTDTYSVTYQRAAGAEDGTLAFDADGNATLTLKHNESVTIKSLPEGATYTVTEVDTAGYTPDEASKTGTIPAGDDNASVEFTNIYTADEYEGVPVGFELTKTFTKHEWTADYSFQFRLTGVDKDGNPAPLPKADENAGVTVDGDAVYKTVTGPQESGSATFNFGEIEYTKAGIYTYTVTEVEPDHDSEAYNPGINYSKNEATITVTVTDRDQSGASTGALSASASVEKGLFTNEYQTGFITVDAVCGLDVVKNMTGHAIEAGDFTFMMKGADNESIARMNDGNPVEFATTGAALGTGADDNTATETVEPKTGMMFGIEDVGHTYTYNVYEVIPEGAVDNGDDTWTFNGVTYDGTQHKVAYDVTENGRGGLLVEVFVDGESCGYVTGSIATLSLTEQPTITFNNSYDAGDITVGGEDGVEFVGGKELANRPLEDGEFTFDVYDAKNAWVTGGTNAADGTITFGGIIYDMAKLNTDKASGAATATTNDDGSTVFEYIYNIVEDQSDFEMDGISTTTPSINVTVQVTDDGKGNLTAQVVTPVENIQFKNIYGNGEGGTYESNLTGSKLYVDNELENAPDIEGLYTFTVTVPEGAPEPERLSANNDADGNVDFGVIEFTMDNVFTEADAYNEDGTRTKTFEYVVTESGNVEGVDNDSMDIRTITYTVTDMGDGRLDVQKTPAPDAREGKDFTFTNTYDVDSEDSSLTGEDGFSITKTLNSNTSRALSDDEFSFTLTDVATKEVVATATNAADGTVSFPAITFNEPGTYNYRLEEVKGDAPGVTYDTDWYGVTAFVEDNGNGTLGVEWVIEGVEPGASVVFENTYEADPSSITFGALKTLAGRDMVEGEFTFELTDPEGNAVTATNTATGSVVFPTVEFTEEGTYEYTVSEVLPADDDAATEGIQKDGVTYDEKVWTATVTVVDNPETGVLEATVNYGNGTKLAEFHNTYVEPEEPVVPEEPADEPDEPKFAQTNDSTPWMLIAGIAVVAAVVVAVGAFGLLRTRRR